MKLYIPEVCPKVLLAVSLALAWAATANAREATYRGSSYSFHVPSSWQVTKAEPNILFESDRKQERYEMVVLSPRDGRAAMIGLIYRRFQAGVMCGSASQYIEGLVNTSLKIAYMSEHYVSESFPAGTVVTVQSTRNLHSPGAEQISSTVCNDGRVAYVFAMHMQGDAEILQARRTVLGSLSFAGAPQGIVGSWNGQSGVLTLGADRQAEFSFYNRTRSIGTYEDTGGRIRISWTQMMSVPVSATWSCNYSVSGEQLKLNCDVGGERIYTRSSLQ